MKGAVTILQAILIFAIAVSLVAVAVPWAYNSIQKSLDISEMDTVRDQMGFCNDKLVETARTGTSNKCIFNANRGKISAKQDGIYYDLVSKASICDEHSWGIIDKARHLETMCEEQFSIQSYTMRWRWPQDVEMAGTGFQGELLKAGEHNKDIWFDDDLQFITISVVVTFDTVPGQAGNEVEISRTALTETEAKLKVNIR